MSSTSTTQADNSKVVTIPGDDIRCHHFRITGVAPVRAKGTEVDPICDQLVSRDNMVLCRQGHPHSLAELVRTLRERGQLDMGDFLEEVYQADWKDSLWFQAQADLEAQMYLRTMKHFLQRAHFAFNDEFIRDINRDVCSHILIRIPRLVEIDYINLICQRVGLPELVDGPVLGQTYNQKSWLFAYFWYSASVMDRMELDDSVRDNESVTKFLQKTELRKERMHLRVPTVSELYWIALMYYFPPDELHKILYAERAPNDFGRWHVNVRKALGNVVRDLNGTLVVTSKPGQEREYMVLGLELPQGSDYIRGKLYDLCNFVGAHVLVSY